MTVHATMQVGGATMSVVEVTADEGLNRLFTIEAHCRLDGAAGDLAGAIAVLSLDDGFGNVRNVSGLVARCRSAVYDDGHTDIFITLRPQAFALTAGRQCRVFHDATAVDIAAQVLSGVPHRFEVAGGGEPYAYRAQYRESDWDFVCRLLAAEGIYYWFDHDAGSQLVLCDDSSAAPDLAGGALIEFHGDNDLERTREAITAIGQRASVTTTAFAVRSFDPDKPDLVVEGAAGGGALESYDAPGGGPLTSAGCAQQCQLKQAAAASRAQGALGLSNSVRLTAGRIAEVSGSVVDGRYLVTGVRYRVAESGVADDSNYSCDFDAIAASTRFAPPQTRQTTEQAGVQFGVVVGPGGEEIYPDEAGRARVQLHWDREGKRDEKAGTWLRVAQRGAASSLQVPRVGWNVITFNDEGAVDAPQVLSRIHDGDHMPAYELPGNKSKLVFKTATSPVDGSCNEIRYEDRKGSELMTIIASRDMNKLVRNDNMEAVQRDARHEVGNDHSLLVGADLMARVGRDQRVDIGGDQDEVTGGNAITEVQQNATLTIADDRDVGVEENRSITVAGRRELRVGTAMIDTCIGSISASSKLINVLVGGAQAKAAAKGISETTQGMSHQLIGGAKLEFIKKGRSLKVKKGYFETVGGSLVMKTAANFTDNASLKAAWTVGAMVKTKAPAVVISAEKKVSFQCGKSKLIVTPDGVELCGPALDLSGATLDVDSPRIDHNKKE